MGIFTFWWDCIKWAFWRWESAYRMLTTFVIFLGLLGVGGIAFATWANQVMALVAVVPIIIILVFIAPYKLWKEKADVVKRMTTKRLEVRVKEAPEHFKNQLWCHLIVRNPSDNPIEGCYGRLVSFEPNENKRPYETFGLPWSAYSGGTKTIIIPGTEKELLDVAMAEGKSLYIPTFLADTGARITPFDEKEGVYTAIVRVGSKKEAFKATEIKLKIVFKNGDLRMKRLRMKRINQTTQKPKGYRIQK
jgi:hypothetical protein